MRVVTLSPEIFKDECRRLGDMALQDGPYDLIIGVRNGGAYVADAIQETIPQLRQTKRCDVSLQRSSTPRRTRNAAKWLLRLPRPLLNLMRMCESIHDSKTEHREKKKALAEDRLAIPKELLNLNQEQLDPNHEPFNLNEAISRILIADDAADSGVTLAVVYERVKSIFPEAEIVTAVLTVTRPNPMLMPKLYLYSDRTLLRFPWSNDYNPNWSNDYKQDWSNDYKHD